MLFLWRDITLAAKEPLLRIRGVVRLLQSYGQHAEICMLLSQNVRCVPLSGDPVILPRVYGTAQRTMGMKNCIPYLLLFLMKLELNVSLGDIGVGTVLDFLRAFEESLHAIDRERPSSVGQRLVENPCSKCTRPWRHGRDS